MSAATIIAAVWTVLVAIVFGLCHSAKEGDHNG